MKLAGDKRRLQPLQAQSRPRLTAEFIVGYSGQ